MILCHKIARFSIWNFLIDAVKRPAGQEIAKEIDVPKKKKKKKLENLEFSQDFIF